MAVVAAQWNLSSSTLDDLARSGITPDWALRSGIKDASSGRDVAERLSSEAVYEGYVIPYHDLSGTETDHWRMKVLRGEPGTAKYRQPHKSQNHAYIPVGMPVGWQKDTEIDLIITEGEKKAIAASMRGLACIGLGGVDSWRSRWISVQPDHLTKDADGSVRVRLDKSASARVVQQAIVPELADIEWHNRNAIIVFDSDAATNPDVQRAAFDLALWLDAQHAEVTQFFIPADGDEKVGLDDWLLADGDIRFGDFPLPANVPEWLNEWLDKGRLGRDDVKTAARVVVGALDLDGSRYKDSQGVCYFFHNTEKVLHPFRLDRLSDLRSTSFGGLLGTTLGLETADSAVMSRVADRFIASAVEVSPHRGIYTTDEAVYFQLSDARMARVDGVGIDFLDNGVDDVLFLPDVVEPLDENALWTAIEDDKRGKPLWLDAFETVNLRAMEPFTLAETQRILAALFYMSPWLYHWNGLMLPIEIAVAEPNSGKTFLYNLRKGVLTGRSGLPGLPENFKDWVASVADAPGLWVCDNLGNVRSDYWHRLNDELARLVTDPHPVVEMRQLYTTSDVARIPVSTVFAITTIKNPFSQTDVLQRAMLYGLDAIPSGRRDGSWYAKRMMQREKWVAEHLAVVRDWMKLASEEWDPGRMTSYRLVGFEQGLELMLKALGVESVDVSVLSEVVSASVTQYDPVIEALGVFVQEWVGQEATISDVVEWAQGDWQRRYASIKTLANSVVLGRYMSSHPYDILQSTGIQTVRRSNQTILTLPTRGSTT